ncbi:MAG: hypothetical protein PHR96_03325 [Clostridia bacterium]|nr:hypothetical protein [Clostridia bacterium]
MVSLEEYSKINNLLSSCNDMIDGKFILANYKIANILKNITDSKEVYNLIANKMNNFNFEREFSKAQLRSSTKENKFVLPDETEKALPLIFCILVGFKNKEIDFDAFLKEYYKTEKGRAEEYSNFATELILPFRNIIAKFFEIRVEDIKKDIMSKLPEPQEETKKETPQLNSNSSINQKLNIFVHLNSKNLEKKSCGQEIEMFEKAKESGQTLRTNEKYAEQNELEEGDENMTEENNEIEDTVKKAEKFLAEVKVICKDIKSELNYDKRVGTNLKEDIIYITNVILSNCEKSDFKNVVALITAYDYMASSVRSIKFLTRELRNLVIEFYNE